VRPRSDGDFGTLAAIPIRAHASDGYPVAGVADPGAWLRVSDEIASWVAAVSDVLVGQVSLTTAQATDDVAILWHRETGSDSKKLAVLSRLFVDPEYRSYGVGRELVQTAVSFSQKLELSVALDVMEKDQAAIRLYERMGARRVGSVVHRHGDGLTEPASAYVFDAT